MRRLLTFGGVALAAFALVGVPSAQAAPPATSPGHTLTRLSDVSAASPVSKDAAVMRARGCADARAAGHLVVLDVGAQSVTGPELSQSRPGVSLAGYRTAVRLSYPNLVTALAAYLDGYASAACNPSHHSATVAVATNNDGDFTPTSRTYYSPASRGHDWAHSVIAPLVAHGRALRPALTVLAADDIEPSFASTAAQARAWEDSYFRTTSTTLVYIGSADGCPTTYGVVRSNCNYGFTQANIYGLAHRGSLIRVLPQVFFAVMAQQWADIDLTGGRGLLFLGSLSDHGISAARLTPQAAWNDLNGAIARVHGLAIGGYAVDLS